MRFTTVLSAQSWPKNATLPCNADCGIAALSGSGPRTAANLLLRQRHRLFPVHGRGDEHVEAGAAGRPLQRAPAGAGVVGDGGRSPEEGRGGRVGVSPGSTRWGPEAAKK